MDFFAGKVALITGAGSGIGEAIASALADRRATVVIADINGEAAERAAYELLAKGADAESAVVDVSNESSVQTLVNRVYSDHGHLDLMINNAGIHIGGVALSTSSEDWRRLMEINYWGVVHGIRAAATIMKQQSDGHIVNISSLAGITPTPTQTIYAASKWAVTGLSLSLRPELAADGIRLTTICPGAIRTKLFEHGYVVDVTDNNRLERLARWMFPADRAANRILRAIRYNRAIAVFPAHAKILYGLFRLGQWILVPYYWFLRRLMQQNES